MIRERRSSPLGILSIQERRFAEALRAQVGDWLAAGEDQVLLSGMIGSRQGWIEAPYVRCPAGLADLADSMIQVSFAEAEVRLVPGIIGEDSCGVPELMRGEETEAMGMLDDLQGKGLLCLPGTHSKWIHLRDHAIVSFSTYMTGEVFAALRKDTILGSNMTSNTAVDKDPFLLGVARSSEAEGLLHHLFSVRTLNLTEHLKDKASASYLSGLLIGHEVRAAISPGACVHLAGASQLCSLYADAIQACGSSFILGEEDAAALGLAALGRRLAWI